MRKFENLKMKYNFTSYCECKNINAGFNSLFYYVAKMWMDCEEGIWKIPKYAM